MQAAPLLDREFLEKLERLTIHWQKSFPGLVGGHNVSRFAGSGRSFSTIAISTTATICAPSIGAPTCAWKNCFSRCSRWNRAYRFVCWWMRAHP